MDALFCYAGFLRLYRLSFAEVLNHDIFFGEKWKNRMEFSESLKKNRDFKTVYSNGKSRANKYLVMYVMDSGREDTRIGISASKKVGNSVVRHRFARLVRESFRLNKDILEEGKDIIVVARAAAKDKNFDKIESAFLHLCGLHNILKESK